MSRETLEEEKIILERNKVDIQMLSTLVTILMLILSLSVSLGQLANMSNIGSAFGSEAWIDPQARILLDNGQPFTAYVYCRKHVVEGAERVWRLKNGFVSKIPHFTRDIVSKVPSDCRVWTYDTPRGSVVHLAPFSTSQISGVKYIHPNIVHGFSRYTGAGVVVAIIDTGVDYLHPDLKDNIVMLVSFRIRTKSGKPLIWIVGVNGSLEDAYMYDSTVYSNTGEYAWLDENGHGTHVAGIIAGTGVMSGGKYVGVAPNAKLVIIKAFTQEGFASTDDILDALEWVSRQKNIDIVNLSFGTTKRESNDPISLAAASVYQSGKIVVAAAGNNGQFPGTIVSPATNPNVIAVAAYDPYHNIIPMFSSMGPVDSLDKPDITADGYWVVAPFPDYNVAIDVHRIDGYYASLSGTSMATAVASGILARWVEAVGREAVHRPGFLEQVCSTLNPLTNKNWLAGYGIIESP